ncbi:cd63 antigen [Echinococcus multilocularis]|uniref:Tetraspanin n=1 Tax=Echinococcus multilocularis TaxID=6211 RepID=A0A068YFH4_ECHMU|nr:cd63 antigen [Echinococcus multilocularis]
MAPNKKANDPSLRCLKLLHWLTIVCIICVSLALIGIASYLVHWFRSNDFTRNYNYVVIPVILLCIGFTTILVCILGVYGSKTDNLCMLKLYAGITCILLLLEICIALAVAILKNNLENYVIDVMKDLVSNYATNNETKNRIDLIQSEFQCCGSNSAIDYRNMSLPIPSSCCFRPNCLDKDIFPKGCTVVLTSYLNHKMLMMSISSFVASVGNAFAFAFVILYVRNLNRYNQIK